MSEDFARGLSAALAMLGDYTDNLRRPERLPNAYEAIAKALAQARCKRCHGTGSLPGAERMNETCNHEEDDRG